MAASGHDQKDLDLFTEATVIGIRDESETIKKVQLHIKDQAVTFKAGQWVDFSIRDVRPYTGYSMCSPPHLLETSGVLELAVKHSDYPPTKWIHEQCQVGDKVKVRVSGNFYYDILPSSPKEDLLLIAGGVGINPIISILQHFVHLENPGKAFLLYSAQTLDELVFKDDIIRIAQNHKNVTPLMFSTRQNVDDVSQKSIFRNGRILESDIKHALHSFNKSNGSLEFVTSTSAYICGPSSFIDDMAAFCLRHGLPETSIHFEKWW